MRSIVKLFFIITVVALSLSAHFAFAYDTVTDIYDQPSSLKVSEGSNHRFVFEPSVHVGENILLALTFPSGFVLSSITEDDVDVSVDGVDGQTDATCSGVPYSVYVSGQTLNVGICPGGGGSMGLDSEVIIEVGTNASAYGSGTNRIINPTEAATYFIWLRSGTDKVMGSIPIPIVSDDDGNVGLTISPTGGGGDGSAPGGDRGDDEEPAEEPEDETPEEEPEDETPTEEPKAETPDESPDEDVVDEESESPAEPIETQPGTEPSEPTTGDGADIAQPDRTIETRISVGNGEIRLDDGLFIPGTTAQLDVIVGDPKYVSRVTVVVDDTAYGLTEVFDGQYSGLIPMGDMAQTITIIVDYVDGTVEVDTESWGISRHGWVYELVDGHEQGVKGAVVIVYEGSGDAMIQWDASRYGQQNPIILGESGSFAFYVPNGVYTVTAAKSGYEDTQVTVRVSNHILAPAMKVARVVDVIDQPVEEPETIVGQAIKDVAAFTAPIVSMVNDIREMPEVQAVANVTKPVAVAAVLGSAGILSSSFNLIPFLRYLFGSPILFFARRKRRRIGIVYNAITKLPVDLAMIRLFSEAGKLVKTTVSDNNGHYILRTNPGRYRLEVKKTGYVFPSEYLMQEQKDEVYEDIYTQGMIEVSANDILIAANIPIDPSQEEKYHAPKKLIFKRFLRVFQNIFALTGLIVAALILLIQPTIFTFALLIVHGLFYAVTRILTKWRKKKGWGIVRDANIKKELANTIVRLFEPKYNRLIESTVTDSSGRYAFMAGPNEYFVTFERPGYEKAEVRPIDYRAKKEPELISVDTELKKEM